MIPPQILEMLAADQQRELVKEAARERLAAVAVGHKDPWWDLIAPRLRHLLSVIRRPGSEAVSGELAIVDHR